MHFETLETPRLLLTGLSPEEMTYIFENYPKADIKKILGHRTEAAYEKESAKQQNGYASYNRRFKMFLLTDKATGAIIGRCGLHNWNVEDRRAEIGYIMEEEACKRKGLMTEAVDRVIEYGFYTLHLNRIEAVVSVTNVPSLRIMEKFNFTREGVMRQQYYTGEKYEDSNLFSLLYQEFIAEKNKEI